MEIEAKFSVPNRQVYKRLARCRDLVGYTLVPAARVSVVDRYLDTPDRRLLEADYFCRLRVEDDRVTATLKSLGGASGAVHRRDEQEVELPAWTPMVAEWPDGPARELALKLTGEAPLEPLFEIRQRRARSTVLQDERLVAEWSLDAVTVALGAGEEPYYELEVELKGEGTEDDLQVLVAELGGPWGLAPETRSKFQRAFDIYRNQPSGDEPATVESPGDSDRLTAGEREALAAFAAGDSLSVARRASIILGWAEGLPTREIAARVGLSAGRVRHWLISFRAERLGIFGEDVAAEAPTPGPAATGTAEDDRSARLAVQPEPPTAPGVQSKTKVEPPTILPDEPMSEAGRKLLYLHFSRMVEHEAGTRSGEDPEALHDMRVATRRMRAAYQLFVPYFDEGAFKPFNKRLKLTGRALGSVRDLDVLLGKVQQYQGELPADQAEALSPLLDAWRKQRESARQELLVYLDGGAYARFKKRFEEFLTCPGAGARPISPTEPVPYQVRHVVAGLLFNRYEKVRAYEPLLPDAPLSTYHALRIDCKRLRYAMEFFRDVLGPNAPALIKQVTTMQDMLGDLHDASVAEGLVADFLHEQALKHATQVHPAPLEGVVGYLSKQWAIQRDLLTNFPAAWSDLIGPDFRRDFGLAAAAL